MSDWLNSHSGIALVAVVVAVVGVRALYLLSLLENPFFGDPVLDSRVYDAWALRIASGDWLGRDAFFMGPLYPYFLGRL